MGKMRRFEKEQSERTVYAPQQQQHTRTRHTPNKFKMRSLGFGFGVNQQHTLTYNRYLHTSYGFVRMFVCVFMSLMCPLSHLTEPCNINTHTHTRGPRKSQESINSMANDQFGELCFLTVLFLARFIVCSYFGSPTVFMLTNSAFVQFARRQMIANSMRYTKYVLEKLSSKCTLKRAKLFHFIYTYSYCIRIECSTYTLAIDE